MDFYYTKKFLFDSASLRLDLRIDYINQERKLMEYKRYYWEYGIEKEKLKRNKYKRLTNKELYPNNPPLIGQIRKGKISIKNPYLYTLTSIEEVLKNCKLSFFENPVGLEGNELTNYYKRNMMFESCDELLLGNSNEHWEVKSFFSTALILDILKETSDDNLWKLILAYIPLNIQFERYRIEYKDKKIVFELLIKENWELLLTGIFRATERYLGIGFAFWKFYDNNVSSIYKEENIFRHIDHILTRFYEDYRVTLQEIVDENSYKSTGKDSGISLEYIYQDLSSILLTVYEMETILEGIGYLDYVKEQDDWGFIRNLKLLDEARDLDDEEITLLYTSKILRDAEKYLSSLSEYQNRLEDNKHWGGNYLGYMKKYQYGAEIIEYFKSLDSAEILRPIINKTLINDLDLDYNMFFYIKKHPDCWIARERRRLDEERLAFKRSRSRRNKNR